MTLTQERPKPFSLEELMAILRERPATPREIFSKAVGAVIRSHEEGYISEKEADVLLRCIAAHHVSTTMEDWINSSINDLFEFEQARGNGRSRRFLSELPEPWG